MPEKIVCSGSLYRLNMDHDGESRVTFAIPLSDLPSVLTMGRFTQKLLRLTIEELPGTNV